MKAWKTYQNVFDANGIELQQKLDEAKKQYQTKDDYKK